MQMNFFDLNKFKDNPTVAFFAVCFMLFVIGLALLERNACRVSEYIYTSNRLNTGTLPFICKIL
jgi:hypothetical protein